jgi:serine protease Do
MLTQTLSALPRSGSLALGAAILCNALGAVAPVDSNLNAFWGQLAPCPAVAQQLDEDTWTSIYQQVWPAVVKIETSLGFTGSGVIISPDGLVLTNAHVIAETVRENGQFQVCYLTDCMAATLVDIEDEYADILSDDVREDNNIPPYEFQDDLAILRVQDAQNLPFIPISSTDQLMQGQSVLAVGSPGGSIQNSMTLGIVSQLVVEQQGNEYVPYQIQHDAAVNPGNSGGPLFNSSGSIVGINTLVAANRGGEVRDVQNVSFAIPVNAVTDYLERNNINYQTTASESDYILYQHDTLGSAELEPPADGFYRRYTFSGQAGQRVAIRLISRDFVPKFSVDVPGSSEMIESEADSLNVEMLLFLPTDGLYTIQVKARNPVGQGNYLLTVVDAQILSNNP